jgi:hypothetical protein
LIVCPRCFVALPDGTTTCRICGLPVTEAEREQKQRERELTDGMLRKQRNLWFKHGISGFLFWFAYFSVYANLLNVLPFRSGTNVLIGLGIGLLVGFPLGYVLSWSECGILRGLLLGGIAGVLTLLITLAIVPLGLSPLRVLLSGLSAGGFGGIVLAWYTDYDRM